MKLPKSVRLWLKGAGAWIVTVASMSLAFGLSVSVERIVTDSFPAYPGANLFDEITDWAMVSASFVALASLFFALPALSVARALVTLSFLRMVVLGAVVGPLGACLLAAPMLANSAGGWTQFMLTGFACGIVGAVVWWFLYERSRSMSLSDA